MLTRRTGWSVTLLGIFFAVWFLILGMDYTSAFAQSVGDPPTPIVIPKIFIPEVGVNPMIDGKSYAIEFAGGSASSQIVLFGEAKVVSTPEGCDPGDVSGSLLICDGGRSYTATIEAVQTRTGDVTFQLTERSDGMVKTLTVKDYSVVSEGVTVYNMVTMDTQPWGVSADVYIINNGGKDFSGPMSVWLESENGTDLVQTVQVDIGAYETTIIRLEIDNNVAGRQTVRFDINNRSFTPEGANIYRTQAYVFQYMPFVGSNLAGN